MSERWRSKRRIHRHGRRPKLDSHLRSNSESCLRTTLSDAYNTRTPDGWRSDPEQFQRNLLADLDRSQHVLGSATTMLLNPDIVTFLPKRRAPIGRAARAGRLGAVLGDDCRSFQEHLAVLDDLRLVTTGMLPTLTERAKILADHIDVQSSHRVDHRRLDILRTRVSIGMLSALLRLRDFSTLEATQLVDACRRLEETKGCVSPSNLWCVIPQHCPSLARLNRSFIHIGRLVHNLAMCAGTGLPYFAFADDYCIFSGTPSWDSRHLSITTLLKRKPPGFALDLLRRRKPRSPHGPSCWPELSIWPSYLGSLLNAHSRRSQFTSMLWGAKHWPLLPPEVSIPPGPFDVEVNELSSPPHISADGRWWHADGLGEVHLRMLYLLLTEVGNSYNARADHKWLNRQRWLDTLNIVGSRESGDEDDVLRTRRSRFAKAFGKKLVDRMIGPRKYVVRRDGWTFIWYQRKPRPSIHDWLQTWMPSEFG